MNHQTTHDAPTPAPSPVQDIETRAYALIVRMFRQPSAVLRSALAQDLCRLLGIGLNAEVPALRQAHLLAAKEAIEKDQKAGFLPTSEETQADSVDLHADVLSNYEANLLSYLESQTFHPSASHVPPDYRDGYNHALRTVMTRVRAERELRTSGMVSATASQERSVG